MKIWSSVQSLFQFPMILMFAFFLSNLQVDLINNVLNKCFDPKELSLSNSLNFVTPCRRLLIFQTMNSVHFLSEPRVKKKDYASFY